jgi:hypothetical protein
MDSKLTGPKKASRAVEPETNTQPLDDWFDFVSVSANRLEKVIKHNRFYVDLGNWVDTIPALEFLEHLAKRCKFPVYATLQEVKLSEYARGIRIGLAHTSKEALSLFPDRWKTAALDNQVPMAIMDNDEITVNRDVTWMIKDINPGLVGDYEQQ